MFMDHSASYETAVRSVLVLLIIIIIIIFLARLLMIHLSSSNVLRNKLH